MAQDRAEPFPFDDPKASRFPGDLTTRLPENRLTTRQNDRQPTRVPKLKKSCTLVPELSILSIASLGTNIAFGEYIGVSKIPPKSLMVDPELKAVGVMYKQQVKNWWMYRCQSMMDQPISEVRNWQVSAFAACSAAQPSSSSAEFNQWWCAKPTASSALGQWMIYTRDSCFGQSLFISELVGADSVRDIAGLPKNRCAILRQGDFFGQPNYSVLIYDAEFDQFFSPIGFNPLNYNVVPDNLSSPSISWDPVGERMVLQFGRLQIRRKSSVQQEAFVLEIPADVLSVTDFDVYDDITALMVLKVNGTSALQIYCGEEPTKLAVELPLDTGLSVQFVATSESLLVFFLGMIPFAGQSLVHAYRLEFTSKIFPF